MLQAIFCTYKRPSAYNNAKTTILLICPRLIKVKCPAVVRSRSSFLPLHGKFLKRMFKQYWRTYPWWMQLSLFILLSYILFWLFQAIALAVVPMISTNDLSKITENSPTADLNASLLTQLLASVSVFALPPLLFAYLTHPRPARYLGLNVPPKKINLILSAFVMLGALPLLLTFAALMSKIDFGATIRTLEETSQRMMEAYLSIRSAPGLIFAFLVLAIVPAFGEELFFRGILMRFAARRRVTMIMPIVMTALIFALIHLNPSGTLSIFFAGIILATIYYLTGSIWCSIIAHMSYNGFQVCLTYFGKDNAAIKEIVKNNSLPLSIIVLGTAVFVISFYLLWKNRTPLPPAWADDFTQEELSEKAV
jgi:membrane protease YdiL (CAAX protease family)